MFCHTEELVVHSTAKIRVTSLNSKFVKLWDIFAYPEKNKMKNVHLLKFNLLVQIGREVYEHQLTLMTPNKSFLNRLDLNVYNPSQS